MWNILKKSQVEKERGIYQVLSLIDEFPKCQSRFVDWRPHFEPAARGAFFSNWRGQPIKIVQGICTQAIITMIFGLFERNKKKKTIIFWLVKKSSYAIWKKLVKCDVPFIARKLNTETLKQIMLLISVSWEGTFGEIPPIGWKCE